MSNPSLPRTVSYCRNFCPYIGGQLQNLERDGLSSDKLPKKMCPMIAAIAIQKLAENIVDRAPDSEIIES
jgi:hypothetical protein